MDFLVGRDVDTPVASGLPAVALLIVRQIRGRMLIANFRSARFYHFFLSMNDGPYLL